MASNSSPQTDSKSEGKKQRSMSHNTTAKSDSNSASSRSSNREINSQPATEQSPSKKRHLDNQDQTDSRTTSRPVKRSRVTIGSPDFGAWVMQRSIGTGEGKTDWSLRDMPEKADDIVKAWNSGNFFEWMRAVAQAVGYALDNGVPYTFLSSYNRTWFILLDSQGNAKISDCILATQSDSSTTPGSLRAFAFWMELAMNDTSTIRVLDSQRRSSDDFLRRFVTSQESEGSVQTGSDEDDPEYTEPQGRKRNSSDSLPLAKRYEWQELQFDGILGEGRSGKVYLAHDKKCSLAVKVFDLNHQDQQERLDRELDMFSQLRHLQGILIIPLLGITTSPSGALVGLIMPVAQTVSALTPDTNLLLQALRSEGYQQEDVRPENFLIYNQRLVLCDLESVSRCSLPLIRDSPRMALA